MKIDHDLENSPLYVKTDSVVGSDETIGAKFFTAQGEEAGGILIHFKSAPQYRLHYCQSDSSIPILLPSATDKVWRMTLMRSPEIRIIIHCNDVVVINVLISDCDDGQWTTYWTRDVERIQFLSLDTASDFYSSQGKIETLKLYN